MIDGQLEQGVDHAVMAAMRAAHGAHPPHPHDLG